MNTQQNSQNPSQQIDIDKLQEILRPIREYWAVWDINLVPFLDDYLFNLSNIDISQDFNPETLNFSQAGLLIQGSTNIYAKKVKHLYDLVSQSTSLTDNSDDQNKNGNTKRKKKQIDWVIDDKLAPIEDPDIVETNNLEEELPRLEITTMPKIPFCLLHSLDTQNKNDQTSFRINIVPDEKHCVILLDSSQNINDYSTLNYEGPISHPRYLQEEPVVKFNSQNEKILESPINISIPNLPNEILDEIILPDLNLPEDNLIEDNNNNIKKKHKEEPKLLDPDAPNANISIRPFKKMKKFNIPIKFQDDKKEKKKKLIKKPFHGDIFNELFEKVKLYREKRFKAEDIEAIESIPIENGREHLLEDLDTIDNDPINIDIPSDIESPSINDNNSNEYTEICKNYVLKMVEEGRRNTITSSSVAALADWENKLIPILENEQNRKQFNINETREWILSNLELKNGEITFQNLTSGLQSHEISRVFLSSLMLVNSRNINIIRDGFSEGNFLIKLISNSQINLEIGQI